MAALHRFRLATLLGVLTLVFTMTAIDYAEARRGGSFGSRGARTHQAAPATNTAPAAAPVQRSTTPGNPAAAPATAGAAAAASRGGMFGSPLMRGLLMGGLIGALMGAGFGGMGGMLAMLAQLAIFGGLAFLLFRLFRSRQPAAAGNRPSPLNFNTEPSQNNNAGGGAGRDFSHLGAGVGQSSTNASQPDELGIMAPDLEIFEQRLHQLQQAFGKEDYAAIREITTPEIMSYLSEELGQNATRGVKSEVRDVHLEQGDIAESWKEGSREFATVAMRYSMILFLRDRQTGEIVEGSDSEPVESSEIWTFLRDHHDEWKITAIQEA
ncbi:Tim44 domain-containing protein [Aureimonas fodinaquatilis]|uniref:Tim44 domain-containing protein n=2 Tax=Aureimonas fodinaquatilis TaxID=2565783 RepID=A0A5B0E0J8_9HYPH|nr:Tim44 domain-containing protein [Aureimonas fodinaquatilis]